MGFANPQHSHSSDLSQTVKGWRGPSFIQTHYKLDIEILSHHSPYINSPQQPWGGEIKSGGCSETTGPVNEIRKRKATRVWKKKQMNKKCWLRINIDDLVSGRQSEQSACERLLLPGSARRDLFFCFCGVKFLNGLESTWSLSGKHEWPCSIGRLCRMQAQKTNTLIRFCNALGERGATGFACVL